MSETLPNRLSDPELEARIVDMVLGEASIVEQQRLQNLIDQDPELKAFQLQIEWVHGLLGEAGKGKRTEVHGQQDWKLPDEKRSALLAVLAADPVEFKAVEQVELASNHNVRLDHRKPDRPKVWNTSRLGMIIASIAVVGLMIVLVPRTILRQAPPMAANSRTTVTQDGLADSLPSDLSDLSALSEEVADRDFFDGQPAVESRTSEPERFAASGEGLSEQGFGGRGGMMGGMGTASVPAPRAVDPASNAPSPRAPEPAATAYNFSLQQIESNRKGLGESTVLDRKDALPEEGRGGGQNQNLNLRFRSLYRSGESDSASTIDMVTPRIHFENEEVVGNRVSQGQSTALSEQKLDTFNSRGIRSEPSQNAQGYLEDAFILGGDKRESVRETAQDFIAPASLEEMEAGTEAVSTFSLHVSDVSFKLAQNSLARGEWPDKSKIRIEEFVNAFDYGDPLPSDGQAVSCTLEQNLHPFLQRRNLLRISMRTAATGRASTTPLRLTILLDSSGSMDRLDRRQTVRAAFQLLTEQLQPQDQVTLITFARQARLLADQVPASEARRLIELVENLPVDGGTNIESAIQLAFEKALEQKTEGAENRIVMLTDGAVNLGDANPDRLSSLVASMRTSGIAFDAAGISAEGLRDQILEALTRKGDGRYYLLDSPQDADQNFAKQIAGALRPSAKNVKVQVEFNPQRVGRYKLLGFEQHRLNTEDFRNDQVDAAEMAAAEAGVAVYQFEPLPDGQGDVGSVSVRFQDLTTGQMVEHRWPIPYQPQVTSTDRATPSMQVATIAALLAAKLKADPMGELVDLATLSDFVARLPDEELRKPRVESLKTMIQQARAMGL